MRFVVCCAGAMLLARTAAAEMPVAGDAAAIRYVISTSAVAAAIKEAGLPVVAARVHLPGAVSARAAAPALKINAAEQRGNGALAVRVACRNPAECMPFFATVDAAEDHEALAAFAARSFPSTREAARTTGAGVAVGARVRLELVDAQMHIELPVIAIDTGAPGVEVRVASLDRKHTWRGVVVDATTVRGGVQ